MQRTLDLSLELCTSGWNMYAAMALPGSELYKNAFEAGVDLPTSYTGYSFHSEDSLPLSTEFLTASEILAFRDRAFHTYHENAGFLARIESIFGKEAVENILDTNKIKLKRMILN